MNESSFFTYKNYMSLNNLKVQSYIVFEPEIDNVVVKNMYTVTLDMKIQIDKKELWGIYYGNNVLDKTVNNFVYEPMPSSRNKQFLKDCRFKSAQEAYDFWIENVEKNFQEKVDIEIRARSVKINR